MKRYLVFNCSDFYPNGGWFDYKDGFDDMKEAVVFMASLKNMDSSAHVVDTETKTIIYRMYGGKLYDMVNDRSVWLKDDKYESPF